jgi:hypothetical protein
MAYAQNVSKYAGNRLRVLHHRRCIALCRRTAA